MSIANFYSTAAGWSSSRDTTAAAVVVIVVVVKSILQRQGITQQGGTHIPVKLSLVANTDTAILIGLVISKHA